MNKQIRQVQCRQGFINTIIIGVIVIIIAAAGYFAVTRKTAEAPMTVKRIETTNKTVENNQTSKIKSSITVLSPNGGEKWTNGTNQTIKWSAPSSIKFVNILFGDYDNQNMTDHGSLFIMFNSVVNNTPNDGSFEWNVGMDSGGYNPLHDGHFVILVQDSSAHLGDESDAPFIIVK